MSTFAQFTKFGRGSPGPSHASLVCAGNPCMKAWPFTQAFLLMELAYGIDKPLHVTSTESSFMVLVNACLLFTIQLLPLPISW